MQQASRSIKVVNSTPQVIFRLARYHVDRGIFPQKSREAISVEHINTTHLLLISISSATSTIFSSNHQIIQQTFQTFSFNLLQSINKMLSKTAIQFLALMSTTLAVAPSCSQEGNSLQLADGTWPHVTKMMGNVYSASACQASCISDNECYSSAYNKNLGQCHFYDDVVGKIGFFITQSGYNFTDNCCKL